MFYFRLIIKSVLKRNSMSEISAYIVMNGVQVKPIKCNYEVNSQEDVEAIRKKLRAKHYKDRVKDANSKYANDFKILFHLKCDKETKLHP